MYKITSSIAFHESNASAIPPIADYIFNGKMMRIGRDPQFDKLSFGQKIEYNSSAVKSTLILIRQKWVMSAEKPGIFLIVCDVGAWPPSYFLNF